MTGGRTAEMSISGCRQINRSAQIQLFNDDSRAEVKRVVTASAIAKELGILQPDDRAITGASWTL